MIDKLDCSHTSVDNMTCIFPKHNINENLAEIEKQNDMSLQENVSSSPLDYSYTII